MNTVIKGSAERWQRKRQERIYERGEIKCQRGDAGAGSDSGNQGGIKYWNQSRREGCRRRIWLPVLPPVHGMLLGGGGLGRAGAERTWGGKMAFKGGIRQRGMAAGRLGSDWEAEGRAVCRSILCQGTGAVIETVSFFKKSSQTGWLTGVVRVYYR